MHSVPVDEPYSLSDEQLRQALFEDHREIHARFTNDFGPEIATFLRNAGTVCAELRTFAGSVQPDRRAAWCEFFMYGAFDLAFTSCHLLISGMMAPSGHLMRSFGESSAMALLCSHHAIDVLQRLEADPQRFPITGALDLVLRKRNANLLRMNPGGWDALKEITKWYDRFSHATVFSLQSQLMFSDPNVHVLVSEYDDDKIEFYEKEITLRVSAMDRLSDLVNAVTSHVAKAQNQGLVV